MISTVPFDVVHRSPKPRNQLRVSVITPAFNPGPDMSVTVRSINAQTNGEFEWIIVDDCSADDQASEIKRASDEAKVPVTVLRHRQNSRQAQARNTGITHAAAPLIKFLDADDALDPPHIDVLLAALTHVGPNTILFAPTRHLFVGPDKVVVNDSYRNLCASRDAQLARMLTAPFLHHCGALFPRDLLEKLGGYDSQLVTDEDGDLLLRVLLDGWVFKAVPGVNYIYRHHSAIGRVSCDDTLEKISARRRVAYRALEHFTARDVPVPNEIKLAVCQRLDALAVRNWRARREIALDLLDAARKLEPNYKMSGSKFEQMLRRMFGISAAHRAVSAIRAVRGSAVS